MTDYHFNSELDDRLREFITHPGHFVAEIGLVHALHTWPIVAVCEPFVLPVEDKQVLPVFTRRDSLTAFQAGVSDELTYANRSFFEVVTQLLSQNFDAIAFNMSTTAEAAASTILFPREDLVPFLNYYTDSLNKLMANDTADSLQGYYLIPAFVRTRPDGEIVRIFATLSKPTGESFVPVFSNILSFSKWYNHSDFGRPFQEHEGMVLIWQLSELMQPKSGQNDLEDISGLAIDPFDVAEYDKAIILWDDLNDSVD